MYGNIYNFDALSHCPTCIFFCRDVESTIVTLYSLSNSQWVPLLGLAKIGERFIRTIAYNDVCDDLVGDHSDEVNRDGSGNNSSIITSYGGSYI